MHKYWLEIGKESKENLFDGVSFVSVLSHAT